jgi:hypothetical protein
LTCAILDLEDHQKTMKICTTFHRCRTRWVHIDKSLGLSESFGRLAQDLFHIKTKLGKSWKVMKTLNQESRNQRPKKKKLITRKLAEGIVGPCVYVKLWNISLNPSLPIFGVNCFIEEFFGKLWKCRKVVRGSPNLGFSYSMKI